MYNTSDAYKSALLSAAIVSHVRGTLTLSSGTEYAISDSNIIPESLTIDNRATNSGQFSLGSVYVGELNITLLDSSINRYSLSGAQVSLSYYLTLADGTEEEIPLGVYFASEAKRNRKTIALTCYDAMTEFDTEIAASTNGTPYEILSYMCEQVGVELGSTQEELEAMPNGTSASFNINAELVSTYREALAGIAAMLCGFATIGRDGKLYVRPFSTTPAATIGADSRTSSTVSDYSTEFVSVKMRFMANENYYPYTALTGLDYGIVLDAGDNPSVAGTDTIKNTMLQAVADTLAGIVYVPVEMEIISDPSIDLGDALTVSNVNGTTDSVLSIVTCIQWKYHRTQKVMSEGLDPHSAGVKDSTAKAISTIESKSQTQQLLYYSFTNASAVTVSDDWVKVISIDAVTVTDTDFLFLGEMHLTAASTETESKTIEVTYDDETTANLTFAQALPTDVEVKYKWKDEDLTFLPREYMTDGPHILNLTYFLANVEANTAETFEVWMRSTNGTVTLPKGQCMASIIAQGLVAKENEWDGNIEITEEIGDITISAQTISVVGINESLTTKFFPLEKVTFTESIGAISITPATITVEGITESFTTAIETQIVEFALNEYTTKNESGQIVLADGVTDAQTLYSTNYGLNGDIENVKITSSDDVIYAVSFDSGETWQAYDGSEWQTLSDEQSGMDNADFASIPVSEWKTQAVNDTLEVRVTLFTSDSYVESVVINYL